MENFTNINSIEMLGGSLSLLHLPPGSGAAVQDKAGRGPCFAKPP